MPTAHCLLPTAPPHRIFTPLARGGPIAASAAAHAAAVAKAIKASGTLVRIAPEDFASLVKRSDRPLIVVAQGGVIRKHYRYLMSYKGLAFFTQSAAPLIFPGKPELIMAGKIWVPD